MIYIFVAIKYGNFANTKTSWNEEEKWKLHVMKFENGLELLENGILSLGFSGGFLLRK